MQDYLYSVIAFLAILIHLIINYDMLPLHGRKTSHIRGAHEYRGFLAAIFYLYITDALWGVFAGLGWTKALYFDTMSFFIATAVSILAMCHFIITYLGTRGWRARALSWFGYVLLSLYVVMLFVNVFEPCLFYFDAEGKYATGFLRNSMYYPLVAACVLTAGIAFVKAVRNQDIMRKRYFVVSLFCLTMGGAIFLQIIWTLWPFYALGCLISNCFIHVFLIEDERSELQQDIIKHEEDMKHMAESEKARSMFFSTVSHDIRTPLNAIIGYSELLLDGIDDRNERVKALSAISTSGHTLLELINDVLDLSKLESGKMVIRKEPTDVRELISSVVHSFEVTVRHRNVELKEDYGDLPVLEIDPQRVRQILFNLIGNAAKFTEKGEICVRASFRNNIDNAKGVFTLSVSDTGCGIAEEDKEKVMNPFVQVGSQAKIKGTGLGLPICKQLAASMGGQLSFVSQLGKGSTFTLELFDVKKTDASAEQPDLFTGKTTPAGNETTGRIRIGKAGDEQKSVKSCHILIADDVPLNLSVLKALLKKVGVYDVETAVDGQDAWKKIQASERPFDCILTDIWMPEMNGRELVAKIRADERLAELPVYAVTADVEEQKNFAERGFTGVLLKPLTIDTLSEFFKE
jgi:signal transduction histidine kinase/CheY-like chemotaxis protein